MEYESCIAKTEIVHIKEEIQENKQNITNLYEKTDKLNEKQKKALVFINNFLKKWKGTGVQQCLNTAVFDLLPLKGKDIKKTPSKTDHFYYFRPWKTIMARTVADGGESFYIQGHHRATVSNLARNLLQKVKKTDK